MTKPIPLIHIDQCNLEFKVQFKKQHLKVLHNITVDIERGEFFVFLGPSGSGKSTLLRIMSGIEKAYTGTVIVAPDIRPEDMAFVFQQSAVFPWLTVYDNIALGLRMRYEPETQLHKKVMAVAAELGLHSFMQLYPRELSGGMKQRVGIARALVIDPKIIFMDEPFSGLDTFTATELRKELLRIWAEKRMTIVLVTHSISEAIEMADRIAVVSTRPATIQKIFENPISRPRLSRTEPFYQMEDAITALVHP